MPLSSNSYLMKILPILLCLAIIMILILGHNSTLDIINSPVNPLDIPKIVTESDLPIVVPHTCVRSEINNDKHSISWLICTKNNFELISKFTIRDGIWGRSASEIILDMLKRYPESPYLDIGSNLGNFVTMAANVGHRVYAVDPIRVNLANTRKSLVLANNQDRVTLINNAVSDKKIKMIPWQPSKSNEGIVYLIDTETAKEKPVGQLLEPVYSVTLKQLLDYITEETVVLKVDTEGSECRILTNYLFSKNKTKFIPYMYVEWVHIQNNLNSMCPDLNKLIQGFYQSGYKAMSKLKNDYVEIDPTKSRWDILWVHKNASPL